MQPYRNNDLALEDEAIRRAREQLEPELDPGETLLWVGTPRQGVYFDLATTARTVWCGLAVAFGLYVVGLRAWRDHSLPLALFCAAWCGVPALVVVQPIFFRPRSAAKTFYGLTERRVLIVRGLEIHETSSFPLETIPLEVLTLGGAFGTIYLEPLTYDSRGRHNARASLNDISSPRRVEKLIREAMKKTQVVTLDAP
jgi:hypothetical protein